MKVYFYTLGCKVNQYDSQEMSEIFIKENHIITNSPEDADVIVVNSCTVTAESVRKTRQTVRRLKKNNPSAILILTGCASQAEPETEADLPDVDIFMGNRSNTIIIDALKEYLSANEHINKFIPHLTDDVYMGTGITAFEGHTRAFLKIQDGCDRYCSYCLIPTARGRSRSKALEDIDKELCALEKNGYTEIVFVGINLSDYGKNTPFNLSDALMLAEKYKGITRVRLGSLEPDHLTDELIDQLKTVTKLCPHFHISLQSGCNNVLKKMNRHYTAEEYKALAKKLRDTFSDASITTDILVGFPSETEEDFKETLSFAKEIGFEKIHVFPYSVRKGTRAAKMEQLTKATKEARASELGIVAEEIRRDFFNAQIFKQTEVLFETMHEGYNEGYTKNYTPVRVFCEENLKGRTLTVTITGYEDDFCTGVLY